MVAPVAAAAGAGPIGWAAIAGVALLGAVKGIAGGGVKKAQAEANNRLSAASAEVNTQLRTAGNQAKAAENALDLWSQAVNNSRRQRAVGSALEAQAVTISRQLDQAVRGKMSGSIREAEQSGGQAAAAAAAGLEGSVVDRVAGATQLRGQIGEELVTRTTGQAASDVTRRAGMLTSQLLSLDMSQKAAGLDYNRQAVQTQGYEGTMRSAIGGILASGAVEGAISYASAGNTSKTANLQAEPGMGAALRERSVNSVGGGDLADFAFDTQAQLGYDMLDLQPTQRRVRLGG
jgi:hypothetical protein